MTLFIEFLFLIAFLALFIFFIFQFYNIFFKGYAPVISTKKKYINKIIENINIEDNKVIYELGCGNAGFLKKVRKKNNLCKLVGVENSLILYINSQIQNALFNLKINFFNKDLFKVNLEKADIVYCYLNNKTMANLKEKFLNECKNGSIIVSYQFPIPKLEPCNTIQLANSHKLLFYKIKK